MKVASRWAVPTVASTRLGSRSKRGPSRGALAPSRPGIAVSRSIQFLWRPWVGQRIGRGRERCYELDLASRVGTLRSWHLCRGWPRFAGCSRFEVRRHRYAPFSPSASVAPGGTVWAELRQDACRARMLLAGGGGAGYRTPRRREPRGVAGCRGRSTPRPRIGSSCSPYS